MLFVGLVCSISVGVFDAGSTGTRLKLFEFDRDTIVSQSLHRSEDVSACGERKGLHQSSTAEVKCIVGQLLSQAKVQKSTVLGFYGTGGMRSVSTAKQDAVLEAVREAAKDYNLVESKIITGSEEALYSLKGFEYLEPDEHDFAIIDMGGKSVQIIQKKNKEITLSSLQMGVLNSTCEAASDPGGLLSSLRKFLMPRLELYEPVAEKSDRHYICREEAWSFDCRPCDTCGDEARKDAGMQRPPREKTAGLKMQMIDLPLPGHRPDKRLPSSLQSSSEIQCIEMFFKTRPIERLRNVSRIYLMSFFEEVVEKDRITTLGHLFESFRKRCPDHLESICLKLYYSILFLEKIGVFPEDKMRLLNRMQGVDVSWSLGKALELRNKALASMKASNPPAADA